MATITMRHWISGGSPDGSEWPLPGVPFEVSDDEAHALVAGANADWHHGSKPAVAPEPVQEPPAAVTEPPEGEDPDQDPPEPQEAVEGRPGVRDPKEDWINWVVAKFGDDRNVLAAMSKADILQRYRNRK